MSAGGVKNVSCPWLCPFQGWGSLTVTFTGKFVYTTRHFILQRLNPFGLRVDQERCWIEHSISWLWISLSSQGAKKISWLWLSQLRGWSSLTLTFSGKLVNMAHHFILLRLNQFDLRVDRKAWWFEHSMLWLQVCLSAESAKNVSWRWLSPLQGWGGLAMTFSGKFVYMTHHFILLCLNPFGLRFDREEWWFDHSMSLLRVAIQQRVPKTFPDARYLRSQDRVV